MSINKNNKFDFPPRSIGVSIEHQGVQPSRVTPAIISLNSLASIFNVPTASMTAIPP